MTGALLTWHVAYCTHITFVVLASEAHGPWGELTQNNGRWDRSPWCHVQLICRGGCRPSDVLRVAVSATCGDVIDSHGYYCVHALARTPSPLARRYGIAAWTTRKALVRLVATTFCQRSKGQSSIRLRFIGVPALLMRMSSRCVCSTHRVTRSVACEGSAKSACNRIAWPPRL